MPLKDLRHYFCYSFIILHYFYCFLLRHITHSAVNVTSVQVSLRCLLRVHSFCIWKLSIGYDDDTVTPLAKVSHWTQPWASLSNFPSSQIVPAKIHSLAITPPLSWPPKWTNIFWKCLFILSSNIWINPPASRNIKFVSPFVREQTVVSM